MGRTNVRLREITTVITKGTTPSSVGCAFEETGVNFIKAESVTLEGRIDESIFAHISEATHEKLRRSQLAAGDILFSIAGMKLGKSAVVRERHLPANTNQALALIRPDPIRVISEYLHYWFLNPSHYRLVNSITAQSAQPNINLAQVGDLEIFLPPLPIQRRIASILSAYDDLIENCERRIRVLDEMARALYREWFVLFRYPGHENTPLVDSPMGRIPKGWSRGRLDDLMVLQRGFDLPKDQREDGPVPIIAATGVNGFHSVAKVKGPGVVTGRSGSIGQVMYIQEDFWPLNTALWVKEFPKAEPLFAYYVLSNIDLGKFNAGAAVPSLNRNDVHGLDVVVPPRELQRQFQHHAESSMLCKRGLELRVQNLRKSRDLLLPRLLSGQLPVEDLHEKQLEESP